MNTFKTVGEAQILAVQGQQQIARLVGAALRDFWQRAMIAVTRQAQRGDLPL